MKFLIINGKIQTLGGKPIVVPDTYSNDLIKIGGMLVKTGTGLIGSKYSASSGGGTTVAIGATFNDDANGNADGIEGDVFLTWEELKDPENGGLYMYEASAITDTELGPYAFTGCINLTSITIPDGVTSIGESTFAGCESLTNIIIPDGVNSIGPYAFGSCINLTSITIPNSVTSIERLFEDCYYLEDINFNGTLEQLNAMEYVYFGYCGAGTDYGSSIIHCIDKCLDNYLEEIDCPIHGTGPVVTSLEIKTMPNKTAYFAGESFDKTGLVLTATWSDGSTTEVADNEITVVTEAISSSTTEVMVRCLHKICYVPITIRVITSLAIKTMPDKTAYCAGETFDKTGLVLTVTWPDGSTTEVTDNEITVVDKTISSSRPYNRVKYGDKTCNIYIELLNSFALSSSNYIQAGITREGDVIIPETFEYNDKKYKVTSISQFAFNNCTGLTSITIPDGVTSIGQSAFGSCTGLTSITIPDSVKSIGEFAFQRCTGLTSITIPGSVKSIGKNPFADCTKLESITVEKGNTTYSSKNNCNAIIKTATNTLISGCKNTAIPGSVKSIDQFAFQGCTGLTSITIPGSVTSIGMEAFNDCTGLTSITIPGSVKSIGMLAFGSCTGLTSITIPDGVTSIGGLAFDNCTGLTSITIPDSVTSIDGFAFQGCTGLTSITIPGSVTSISQFAFNNCTGLTSITIPDGVTSIGQKAFQGCTDLTSITFNGTQEQWNAITFGSEWNYNTGNYTIHCTDGDIAKS